MSTGLLCSGIVLAALLVDFSFGDPPTALHPVGWIGRYIGVFRKTGGRLSGKAAPFFLGLFCVISGVLITGGIALVLQKAFIHMAGESRLWIQLTVIIAASLILKGSLAFRSLIHAGRKVQGALERGNLPEARRLLSWHLVSRPVDSLSESSVASAVIESLAENFTDSLAAPLFWFTLAGLPGAWIYRFADTADSILGYRDEEREWLGKAAARLDDFLCWIPARMAGLILILAAGFSGLNPREALRIMIKDGRSSSSPNSGWTMAGTAGALGVRLEKPDTYVLNAVGRLPSSSDIDDVIHLLRWGMVLWLLPVTGILLLSCSLFQIAG